MVLNSFASEFSYNTAQKCTGHLTSFWFAHRLGVYLIVALLFILINEVAIIVAIPNLVAMSAITLFSPFWQSILDIFPMCVQTWWSGIVFSVFCLAFPLYLFGNVVALWAVVWLPFKFYNFFGLFATPELIAVLFASWHISKRVANRYLLWFSPSSAYLWLWDAIISRKLWYAFKYILFQGSIICFHLRRVLFIGELLLFPLLGLWAAWPLIICLYLPNRVMSVSLVTPIVLFLTSVGYSTISSAWYSASSVGIPETPAISLTEVMPSLAQGRYGMLICIQGKKSPAFTTQQVVLELKGDHFWSVLSVAMGRFWVSTFKHAFHPGRYAKVNFSYILQ